MSDDTITSPDTRREQRLPPGQSLTTKWPVLDASGPPRIDLAKWRFQIAGLVAKPVEWSWEEFQKLPRVKVFSDFHGDGTMYLLRAVVAADKDPPVLVTLYRTSKIEKYWRPE
jgi:DMSO/TMAO reductase YedYZ molybdopterin-dependent catalytic subunit